MEEQYYVIYFEGYQNMPYCRVNYDVKDNKLVLNGYSLMADWKDATLTKSKEDAIKTIMENIDTNIQRDKLKVLSINIKKDIVYEGN